MAESSTHGVFVSYRREDTGLYARLVKDKLSQRFPGALVFMDLDSIEPGVDFAEAIKAGVDSCVVLVALIGRGWLTARDEDGSRRLDNPEDYVRYEIRSALERGVRVIPVFVDGVKVLQQRDLPDDLRKLARLNALKMTYEQYEYDQGLLMDAIERVLGAGNGGSTFQHSTG